MLETLDTGSSAFTVVDLFSGAGGMSCGFKNHPAFRPIFAVDAQVGKPSCGFGSLGCNETYEANIGVHVREADLAAYSPHTLLEEARIGPGDLDVLISCAPCTGFSRTLGKNHTEDDPRNHLVERTGDFVEVIRPKVLVMENVRELLRGNFSQHSDRLREHLDRLGYSFHASVEMLTRYGLPQVRERALIIAARDNAPIRTLAQLWQGVEVRPDALTVKHTISHLPEVPAGQAHPADPMHVSPSLSKGSTLARLRAIPHDGGSWVDLLRHPLAERLLIPSMKRCVARRDFGSHPDVYGRLWWNRPSVTIKRECAHMGNGRYSHPEQDRLCTVRELALLNGFPENWSFHGTLSNKYRQIGDAVPPLISYQIANLCHWMLTGKRPEIGDVLLPGTSLLRDCLAPKPVNLGLFADYAAAT